MNNMSTAETHRRYLEMLIQPLRKATERQHPMATNDHTGPFSQVDKPAKHQPECEECGKPAEIVWKDDLSKSDTWFYLDCAKCERPLCHDCYEKDEDGDAVCITCLSEQVRAR